MYRTSLFLRVIGHPCVVLAFCLCLINYVGTPVDATSRSQNAEKENDSKTSPKKINENVLPQADPVSTVVEEKANTSDVPSEDTSADRTAAKPAFDNTTIIGSPTWFASIKSGALERTGFVALGIMSILLFFFVIRAIRIRRKKSKSRKYGVITSTASDMEMEPLDRGDDDEEETTLFDAQHHKYSLK